MKDLDTPVFQPSSEPFGTNGEECYGMPFVRDDVVHLKTDRPLRKINELAKHLDHLSYTSVMACQMAPARIVVLDVPGKVVVFQRVKITPPEGLETLQHQVRMWMWQFSRPPPYRGHRGIVVLYLAATSN